MRHPLLFAEVLFRTFLVQAALLLFTPLSIARFLARTSLPFTRGPDLLPVIHVFSLGIETRLSGRPWCLRTALVVFSFSRGLTFKLGVTGKGSAFEAHAWLERNGEVFSGTREDSYEPIWSVSR